MKAAREPTSSGSPYLPSGMLFAISLNASSTLVPDFEAISSARREDRSVRMYPWIIPLEVMP